MEVAGDLWVWLKGWVPPHETLLMYRPPCAHNSASLEIRWYGRFV